MGGTCACEKPYESGQTCTLSLLMCVQNAKCKKPTGHHFNIKGHDVMDMTPMIIEEVRPKNDPNLRLIRESWWITQYQSVEFGANTQS